MNVYAMKFSLDALVGMEKLGKLVLGMNEPKGWGDDIVNCLHHVIHKIEKWFECMLKRKRRVVAPIQRKLIRTKQDGTGWLRRMECKDLLDLLATCTVTTTLILKPHEGSRHSSSIV